MSTSRCPQCSAVVVADDSHCPDCGYPLEWEAVVDQDAPSDADHMVRLPGETDSDDATRLVTPKPVNRSAPAVASGPVVACPSCRATNPAERTLCERCGTGLIASSTYDDPVDDGLTWWQGRAAWLVLLALVVVAGAVVGWRLLRGPSESAAGRDDTAVSADGDGAESQSTETAPVESPVVLRPGDNNADVKRYQRLLDAAGFDLQADSEFGPNTERETRRFQRATGEEPSGAVTERTMAAAERADRLRRVRIFLLRDGRVDDIRRRVDEVQLVRGTLEMLIAAPLQVERDNGLASAIPPRTRVDRVRVSDGVASVSLSGFAADPDQRSLGQRVDQVVATLTRFDAIDAVVLQLPQEEQTVFTEAGVAVDRPLRGTDG